MVRKDKSTYGGYKTSEGFQTFVPALLYIHIQTISTKLDSLLLALKKYTTTILQDDTIATATPGDTMLKIMHTNEVTVI